MTTAIIALTRQGMLSAYKIARLFSQPPDLYIHRHSEPPSANRAFASLREILPDIWRKHQVLIFVMAAGIVVRQIAPFLERKDKDPAVLVVDENCRFVIPLLSGHLGGANAWARYLARELGATAAITTATDGRGLVAPDEYARRLGWKVEPLDKLPALNRLLLERGYLTVWTEHVLASGHPLRQDDNYLFVDDKPRADLIISAFPSHSDSKVCLIPPVLSIGVGCRKGVDAETVKEAISLALTKLGASTAAVKGLYSIELKAQEKGLLEAAHDLGVPFETFPSLSIQRINEKYKLSKSKFVKTEVGVDGVCEAASLLGSGMGSLILPKVKARGVTVAISWEKSLSSESAPEIPLT